MPEVDSPPALSARAIIVEDDSLTRQLIGAHAERLGLIVVEVAPTPEGIEAAVAAAGPDDAVILDIILGPDIDGFEVIRKLGGAGFRGRLIVVSGYGRDYLQTLGSLATALGLRVAGTLEKPLRPAELERCLRA